MSKSFREKEEPEICISIDEICLNTDLLKLFKSFSECHSHFINEPNSLEMLPITTVNMLPVMNRDLFKEKK